MMESQSQDVGDLGKRKATVPRHVKKSKVISRYICGGGTRKLSKPGNSASFAERTRMRTHSGCKAPASGTNTCSNPVPAGFVQLWAPRDTVPSQHQRARLRWGPHGEDQAAMAGAKVAKEGPREGTGEGTRQSC